MQAGSKDRVLVLLPAYHSRWGNWGGRRYRASLWKASSSPLAPRGSRYGTYLPSLTDREKRGQNYSAVVHWWLSALFQSVPTRPRHRQARRPRL